MNQARAGLSKIAEIVPAILVLAWRLWAHPLRDLWRDWIAIAAIYWILLALSRKNHAWQVVTVVMMALLLLIYAVGQLPHTAALLGYPP